MLVVSSINSYFVYIPGKTEGNNHLQLNSKDIWCAPNDNSYKDGIDPKPDEKKCWNSLKDYLKLLVDKEIEKINNKGEINDTI